MLDQKSFYALGQFVARQAREYAKKENLGANEVIDIAV